MVRLEVVMNVADIITELFQFHYGSIGRCLPSKAIIRFFRISIPLWFDWKAAFIQLTYKLINNFNSTMVRLEGAVRLANISIEIFQFHYGSIGSRAKCALAA